MNNQGYGFLDSGDFIIFDPENILDPTRTQIEYSATNVHTFLYAMFLDKTEELHPFVQASYLDNDECKTCDEYNIWFKALKKIDELGSEKTFEKIKHLWPLDPTDENLFITAKVILDLET